MTSPVRTRAFPAAPTLLVCALSVLYALPLSAAVVETWDGDTLTGELEPENLRVETADGELSIPTASLTRITMAGEGAELELVDGTTIQGRLLDSELHVRQELFDRVVAVSDIRSIRFPPPTPIIPAGTAVRLRLLGPISTSRPGTAVFCTSRAVPIDEETLIGAGAPALGRLLDPEEVSALSESPLTFELLEVLAVDGTSVPLRPPPRVREPLAQSGLAPWPQDKVLFPRIGLAVDARTRAATELGSDESPPKSEDLRRARKLCTEASEESVGERYVPSGWLHPDLDYVLAPSPLRVEFPLDGLGSQQFRLGTLVVDETQPELVTLYSRERRRYTVVEIQTRVSVRPSSDRDVELVFDLYSDGLRIAGDHETKEVEEGKSRAIKTRIKIPREKAEQVVTAGALVLRMKMTVQAHE